MKILFIGGNHPRHIHYISRINESFPVSGCIIETREGGTSSPVPNPPSDLSNHDTDIFTRHFANRLKCEEKFFGDTKLPDCPTLNITKEQLNTSHTADFVQSISPDVVLTFGCHMIKTPLLNVLPKNTINMHGGLSPRYRGVATMFWPFYFLEPNHVGTTFHYLSDSPDAGSIIHQSIPVLQRNDTIHDVACKAILTSSDEMVRLLEILQSSNWKSFSQPKTGKEFVNQDFKPEHLRVIYDLFDDDLVNHFLDGKIKSDPPKLIRQF
ncbi:MAG: methionyl-tRNA formyltransferase [Nitrosopumilus sp.]|nr:methionyl-tRNA formyltransferase [Nitrosopumilus sp.]